MFLDFNDKLSLDALASYVTDRGVIVGLTSGCYDLTHQYHLKYWQRCKRFCDILIVGVDDDYLVKRVKGDSRPIFNETQRLAMVESSRYVDAAFLMHDVPDFGKMIDKIGVDYIFKNQDFRDKKDLTIPGENLVREIIYVDDIEEITSTSAFIKKIKEST